MRQILALICFLLPCWLLAAPVVPPEYETHEDKLLFAVVANQPELLENLLKVTDEDDLTEHMVTAARVGNREVCELLIRQGVEFGALEAAVDNRRSELLPTLIEHALTLNSAAQAKDFERAFYQAIKTGQLNAIRLLIQSGIDPKTGYYSKMNGDRESGRASWFGVLTEAARYGDPEIVNFLVDECGLNPSQDLNTDVPLAGAVRMGNYEVAKNLIKRGVDLNFYFFDTKGCTCLYVALQNRRPHIAKLLMDHGAQLDSEDWEVRSVNAADEAGYVEILKRFEAAGVYSSLEAAIQARASVAAEAAVDDEPVAQLNQSGFASQLLDGDWEDETLSLNDTDELVTVAILTDQASSAMGDLMTVEFAMAEEIDLVERAELERILDEHRMNRAGLLANEGLAEMAQFVAADAVILVSEIEVENQRIRHVRWVDVNRGLLSDLRYVSADPEEWEVFIKRYVAQFRRSLAKFRTDAGQQLIPVSVVGAHASVGSASGLRLQREIYYGLEHALSLMDGFVLLDRKSLPKLQREQNIAGREGRFDASALQLEVGFNVVEEGRAGNPVLQVSALDGSSLKLNIDYEGDSVHALCDEIVKVLREHYGLARYESGGTSEVDTLRDAKMLAREAFWQEKTGLALDAYTTMQNAVALGEDSVQSWQLYTHLITTALLNALEADYFDDVTNREIFDLANELLWSYSSFLASRNESPKARLHSRISIRGFEALYYTLYRFRVLSLREDYENELRKLEEGCLALIFSDDGLLLRQAGYDAGYVHAIAANLNYQPSDVVESIVKLAFENIEGHNFYLNFMKNTEFSRVEPNGVDTFLSWLLKYGGSRHQVGIAIRDINLVNYPQSDGFSRISPWNQAKRLQWLNTEMADSDMLKAKISRLQLKAWRPPETFIVNDPLRECFSTEKQSMLIESYISSMELRRLGYSGNHAPGYGRSSGDYEKLWDVEALRRLLEFERDLADHFRGQSPDKKTKRTIKNLEDSIRSCETRLAQLQALGAESIEGRIPLVRGHIWTAATHMRAEFDRLITWSKEPLVWGEGAWWMVGKDFETDRYYLVRIEEGDLKTTYQELHWPESIGWSEPHDRFIEYIRFYDGKMIMGLHRVGIGILDLHSMELALYSDYIPFYDSGRNPYDVYRHNLSYPPTIHAGHLYYAGLPPHVDIGNNLPAWNAYAWVKLNLDTLEADLVVSHRRRPSESPLDFFPSSSFGSQYCHSSGMFKVTNIPETYIYDPDKETFEKFTRGMKKKARKNNWFVTPAPWKDLVDLSDTLSPNKTAGQWGEDSRQIISFTLSGSDKAVETRVGLDLRMNGDRDEQICSAVVEGYYQKGLRREFLATMSEDLAAVWLSKPQSFIFINKQELAAGLKAARK